MVSKHVEDNDITEETSYPRLLVMFRPPSRHTYGFQEGDTYGLPLLELQTLIQDRNYKDTHINFITVTKSAQGPPPPQQNQSRNQSKKKKQKKNYNKAGTQSLYWLESSHQLDEVISTAASRAILTHALFRIEYSASFSNNDWISSVKNISEGNIHTCRDEMTDVISMSNPCMSNEERSKIFQTVSTLLQNHNDDALAYLQRHMASDADRILIHQERGDDVVLHIGRRLAVGPAGTKASPSQTLRRTHRGILKDYALKSRFKVTAGSDSNISTAMEPEIGFLMANLARAGTDACQSVLDPCCGSGSLLLYAASLGATTLVGVDSDNSVWESTKDEFKRHSRLHGGENDFNTQLATPTFFHGDIFDPSSTECLNKANAFDAILCDPPYNVGAPIYINQMDLRPFNFHLDEEAKFARGDTIKIAQYDTIPSILTIARSVLVDGGRLVFFLPVRGEEMNMTLKQLLIKKGWQVAGSDDEQLQIQFGSLQRFTPTFARWLVCMTNHPSTSFYDVTDRTR
jgi:16S rRNA G966 N2-methylase RsmD